MFSFSSHSGFGAYAKQQQPSSDKPDEKGWDLHPKHGRVADITRFIPPSAREKTSAVEEPLPSEGPRLKAEMPVSDRGGKRRKRKTKRGKKKAGKRKTKKSGKKQTKKRGRNKKRGKRKSKVRR